MGEYSKTITLQVPVEVAYQASKDRSYLDYTQDLRKGLTPPSHITKDIPNSLLAVETGAWGTKIEAEYAFRPIGEDSCEITIKYKTRLDLGASTRQGLISEIVKYRILEFGYKAGKERSLRPPPPR